MIQGTSSIAEVTGLIAALGPMIVAGSTLLGVLFTALQSWKNSKAAAVTASLVIDNTVKTVAIAEKTDKIALEVKVTHALVNSRMSELSETIKSESLTIGERLGKAKGLIEQIEKQEAEAAAHEAGRVSGKATEIDKQSAYDAGRLRGEQGPPSLKAADPPLPEFPV